MRRPSNDEYYLKLLKGVASRSTCGRRKVAAILVDENHRVLAMGFNGVPKGFPHCIDHPCDGVNDPSGDTSRCLAVHAEINALLTCADLSRAHTLYCSCSPCKSCSLAIAQTNIVKVLCLERYADNSMSILDTAGITLRQVSLK